MWKSCKWNVNKTQNIGFTSSVYPWNNLERPRVGTDSPRQFKLTRLEFPECCFRSSLYFIFSSSRIDLNFITASFGVSESTVPYFSAYILDVDIQTTLTASSPLNKFAHKQTLHIIDSQTVG
jgi:hypothetical protein